jgi:hypothetical protein
LAYLKFFFLAPKNVKLSQDFPSDPSQSLTTLSRISPNLLYEKNNDTGYEAKILSHLKDTATSQNLFCLHKSKANPRYNLLCTPGPPLISNSITLTNAQKESSNLTTKISLRLCTLNPILLKGYRLRRFREGFLRIFLLSFFLRKKNIYLEIKFILSKNKFIKIWKLIILNNKKKIQI